jgi:nitrogen fixation protein NifU and related proteins
MPEINKLYQEIILNHNKNPRNFRMLSDSNKKAEGYNPICGDQITIYVVAEQDLIRDIGFQGSGCAISRASASMMTESVKGKTMNEVQKCLAALQKMLTTSSNEFWELTGDLHALSGVRQFPVRIKCALLPWQTLLAAWDDNSQPVSTE